MKYRNLRRGFFSRSTWGILLFGLLFLPAASYAEDPVVDSAEPSSAEQGTYDLEVTVGGDNFGPDSEVDFFITGTEDPGGIKVKKVRRKGPKTLKVTIDVGPEAVVDKFDIEVRSRGRTGKGTELFRVVKKTDWVWAVEVPQSGSFNISGGEPIYVDGGLEDGVAVDVTKVGGGKGGLITEFAFAIFKCEEGEACYGNSPVPITIQGVEFEDSMIFPDPTEGPPCIFPGGCGSNPDPLYCLECFTNGPHPYWGGGQPAHEDDYRYFLFEAAVPGDFEDLAVGQGPMQLSGTLIMQAKNTHDTLIEGDEDFHGLHSRVELPGDDQRGYIEIERLTEGSWKVEVQVINVDPRMNFHEYYVGCHKPVNKKGNCPGEFKQTIWGWTSGPLSFQATWSKVTP